MYPKRPLMWEKRWHNSTFPWHLWDSPQWGIRLTHTGDCPAFSDLFILRVNLPWLSQTSPRIGNDSPTIFKSHIALKHESQGLCHHCFTQIIAWLCWIIPAAVCPIAKASKTCLVLDWQSSITLKEHSVALTCQGLPEVCEKGIILFSTQTGHSVLIITPALLTSSFADSLSVKH